MNPTNKSKVKRGLDKAEKQGKMCQGKKKSGKQQPRRERGKQHATKVKNPLCFLNSS